MVCLPCHNPPYLDRFRSAKTGPRRAVMAKYDQERRSHSFKLKNLIHRIHRFIKIRALKRRLSKSSLATTNRRDSVHKHERARSFTSIWTDGSLKHGLHVQRSESRFKNKTDDDAILPTLGHTPGITSPRKTKSLHLMPNLSTPSSSKRWRIGVMRSLDLSMTSLPVVYDNRSLNPSTQGHSVKENHTMKQASVAGESRLSENISHLGPHTMKRSAHTAIDMSRSAANEQVAPRRATEVQYDAALSDTPPALSAGSAGPRDPFHIDGNNKAAGLYAEDSNLLRVKKLNMNASQASSVHIHRIGISRMLRSTSIFSSSEQSGGYASDDSRLKRWNQSSSALGSEDVPVSWGQVLDQGDDLASSSVYSSLQASPRLSIDESLELPSLNLMISALQAPPGADGSIDTSLDAPEETVKALTAALPTASSTSSLGKESRFREELDLLSKPFAAETSSLIQDEAGPVIDKQLWPAVLSAETLPRTSHAKSAILNPGFTPSICSTDAIQTRPQATKSAVVDSYGEIKSPADNALRALTPTVAVDAKQINRAAVGAFLPTPIVVLHESKTAQERKKSAISLLQDSKKQASRSSQIVSRLEVPRLGGDTSMGRESRKTSAASLLARAVQATEAERSAFLLPQNKAQAKIARVRPRSASFCPQTVHNLILVPDHEKPGHISIRPISDSALRRPSAVTESLDTSEKEQQGSNAMQARLQIPVTEAKLKRVSFEFATLGTQSDEPQKSTRRSWPASRQFVLEPVGAWGRYPSHTRSQRSSSAGASDRVIIRDFAYQIDSDTIIDAMQDSIDGYPRKPRIGLPKTGPMHKAQEVLRNYKLFLASPNVEYLKHGHGRRTSVDQGGEVFDNPDLEAIPNITIPVPRAEVSESPQVFRFGNDRSAFEAQRKRQQSLAFSVADSMLSPGTSVYHKPDTTNSDLDHADGQIDVEPSSVTPTKEHSPQHKRNESIMSIRQSSYDLLQRLQESEESERQKALFA